VFDVTRGTAGSAGSTASHCDACSGQIAPPKTVELEEEKVATGKRAVTPALALRVARFAGIAMDELLAGQWLSARVCPHCGHPPEDFVDEETIVE
jgi:hypothetical protein